MKLKKKSKSNGEQILEDNVATDDILEPSDNESSDEEVEQQKLKLDNKIAQKDKKSKEGQEKSSEKKVQKTDPECTIFVGNLPTNTKLKQLKQFYNKFGEIISLRFRSETGKKVLNKSDRKKYGSLNAYVAFKERECAEKAAVATNGEQFKDNHIRCNLVMEKQDKFNQNLNSKSTVFVGNIAFEANDEEIYEFFSSHCGELEYVRRIPKKGIGYVCFKKGVPLIKALKLNGEMFQGRPLRIEKWESKEKIEKKAKRLRKKQAGKLAKSMKNTKTGKTLDTTRPSNNPLLKKIKEKTKKDDTVSKNEHKQKYRKGAVENSKGKDDAIKKKAEYLGLRTDRIKKAKAKKKKEFKNKQLKKIVNILNAPAKKSLMKK